MNKTYGIDPRIWKAVVPPGETGPAWVALAASVCPELIDEGFEWAPYGSLALTETSDVAMECGTPTVKIRNAIIEWVMAQKDARFSVEHLFLWDRRLGAWCALAVAEIAERYISERNNLASVAIKTARQFLLGRRTVDEVVAATNDVEGQGDDNFFVYDDGMTLLSAYQCTCFAARGSAGFASALAWLESAPGRYAQNSVIYTAAASAHMSTREGIYGNNQTSQWKDAQRISMRDLNAVVASAIISYPSSEILASGRIVSGKTLTAGIAGAALGAAAVHLARRV